MRGKSFTFTNVIAFLLAVALLATMVFFMVTIDSQSKQITQLSTNSDALRDQVQGQGVTPVAPPAEKVTGVPGEQGPRGLPGKDGRDGIDGIDGLPGVPGLDSVVPGPIGPQGRTGDAGADSTVPGPAGPPGADSTTPGPAGANGADGQPPTSWTYTDALGVEYECTRTDPFDPTAPRYECAPTEGETP